MNKDFMKIVKCIETSETRGQFKSCEKLIKLFENDDNIASVNDYDNSNI
jgi:hypothetical protein